MRQKDEKLTLHMIIVLASAGCDPQPPVIHEGATPSSLVESVEMKESEGASRCEDDIPLST